MVRIRTLLSLSHALVIGIFIAVFLTIFFHLTRPPGPPPGTDSSKKVTEVLRSKKKPVEIKSALEQLGYRDIQSLSLFDREGRQTKLLGQDDLLENPGFLEHVFSHGDIQERSDKPGGRIHWIALDLEGPRSHVVRVGSVHARDHFFSEVRRNVIIACSISFVAVLLIALLLSRNLARPIRELASVVDRFGREGFGLRSELKATTEVEELSESFNRMAEYIESNTNELRQRKEEAEKTEALRRQFLSDVSHNLRTPLAAILGWNDALIEGVAEDQKLYLTRIRREVLHVTKTVQRLLELSRWERAAPILLKKETPLSDLLMEVAENLQDAAEQAGVSLSFEGLTPGLTIHADRHKARDVLQILLENVIEHAGKGVHAKVRLEDQPSCVLVTVEDDGIGLPDTFQAHTDMERGASEVGRACLGLAIASRLTRAHGSELRLHGRPGGGTVASFSFPKP